MKKFIFLIIMIVSALLVRSGFQQLHLSSSPTPYKLDIITPVFAEQFILLGQKINVNTASRSDLISLPGIGEVMADRIITVRKELGGFQKMEDMRKVKGIGEKTLSKLRQYLDVN